MGTLAYDICVNVLGGVISAVLVLWVTSSRGVRTGDFRGEWWEYVTGESYIAQPITGRVRNVTFSPNDGQVASGGEDKMVREWELPK